MTTVAKLVSGAIVTTIAMASSANAQAATASTVMPVTAAVAATCSVTATALAFGTLSLSGGNNDSTATVQLTCTPGTTYNVGLDNGAHAANGVRNMAGTLNNSLVPYYLYSNTARTVEWGNTIGTNTVPGTAQTVLTSLTVYGRVPYNASLFAAGGYTDAVTVTVTF